ncbi:MAG: redox-regulated ATPase YchF [Candidatus Diapherotrites archaeon]|nr:redox-regulated ATPase YchF [Candidatus Diapherotrites archaeon]
MKIGVVGKPSSGKSTFLNAACLTEAEVAAYPFTTIKPNLGTAYVRTECPCSKFNVKCNPRNSKCVNGIRFVPVSMIDVAGLVPGAHEGRGMGNQFLNDLIDADVLIHVVDASGRIDAEGNPTTDYDPTKDIEFLENEITWWVYGIIKKNWKTLQRKVEMKVLKMGDAVYNQLSGLNIKREDVLKIVHEIDFDYKAGDDKIMELAESITKICKPIVIAANKMDLPESEQNLERIKQKSEHVIPCCAEAELALKRASEHGLVEYIPGSSTFRIIKELDDKQKKAMEFIKKYLERWGNTGVQQTIEKAVFDVLGMIVVYPVEDENKLTDKQGNVLPDAYLMPKGSTALDLAYKIHTDIGEKFIGAIDCKTHKRVGKDYELKDGDIIKILV